MNMRACLLIVIAAAGGATVLARPEWVVEIDATAVIPDGYRPKKSAKKPAKKK